MATPHIEAKAGDIASTVLMPGDPLRAKFIADHYLKDVFMFNDARNMYGYTGFYCGKKVSVMGSGMGIPSMGIYSYELYKFYNVDKIIRIGSCGSLDANIKLFDIVLVDNAYSDSTYGYVQNGDNSDVIASSLKLTQEIEDTARLHRINVIKGNVYSTDVFYKEHSFDMTIVNKYKCIGVEMETFALFHNAKVLGKEASAILTVSDSLITKESTTSLEREQSFVKMIELALKSL
jgi:purine-nucleoside phosphorylase